MKAFSYLLLSLILGYQSLAFSADKKEPVQCDDDFVDIYLAKKSCIIDMESDECLRLSLMDKMSGGAVFGTAAGIGIGGAAAALRDKWINSSPRTSAAKSKYIGMMKDNLKLEKDIRSFEKQVDKIYQKNKKSAMKNKSFSNFDIMTGAMADTAVEINTATKKQIQSIVDSAKTPELKNLYKRLAAELTKDNYTKVGQQEHEKIFKKNFPKEYEKFKPYFEDKAKLAKDYQEKVRKSFAESGETNLSKLHEEYQKNLNKLEENFQKNIIKRKPELKLAFEASEYKTLDDRLSWEFKKGSFTNRSSRNKSSKLTGGKLMGVGATVAGTTAGIAPLATEMWGNYLEKEELNNCNGKESLNLTATELEIFSGDHKLFSRSKVASDRSGDCKNLTIIDAKKTLKLIKQNFDGNIPEGTCKIINNESEQLDALFDDSFKTVSASCDRFAAPSVKIEGEETTNPVFSYEEAGYLLEAPMDPVFNWPDMKRAVVKSNGKTDQQATEEIRNKFPRRTAIETDDGRYDINDISLYEDICATRNKHQIVVSGPIRTKSGSRECDVFRTAMQARLKTTMFKEWCVQEGILEEADKEPTLEKAKEAIK